MSPGGSTTADVLYGTVSGAGTLTLADSTKNITVENISTHTIIQHDSVGLALWHEQMRRWVFIPWTSGGSHWPPLDLHAREYCPSRSGAGVNGLVSYSSTVPCISPVHTISVDKSVFLRGVRNTTTPTCGYAEDFLITIDHAPVTVGQGAVFWSDGNKIRWTRSPSIAKHMFIGDGEHPDDPPFIEFQHGAEFAPTNYWALICKPIDTGFLTSTTAGRPISEQAGINQKWIAPNDVSEYDPGRHLSIKTTGGVTGGNNCIKLRWTAQGVFGTFDFKGIGDELYTVDFDDGIVVGIFGSGGAGMTLVAPRDDDLEDADCSYIADVDINPCA